MNISTRVPSSQRAEEALYFVSCRETPTKHQCFEYMCLSSTCYWWRLETAFLLKTTNIKASCEVLICRYRVRPLRTKRNMGCVTNRPVHLLLGQQDTPQHKICRWIWSRRSHHPQLCMRMRFPDSILYRRWIESIYNEWYHSSLPVSALLCALSLARSGDRWGESRAVWRIHLGSTVGWVLRGGEWWRRRVISRPLFMLSAGAKVAWQLMERFLSLLGQVTLIDRSTLWWQTTSWLVMPGYKRRLIRSVCWD